MFTDKDSGVQSSLVIFAEEIAKEFLLSRM
jgi:hypothetical protein